MTTHGFFIDTQLRWRSFVNAGREPRHLFQWGALIPPLSMAIPALIFSIVALSIVFVASRELALTSDQTSSLIIALYGVPGVLSLALTLIFREPLMVAWNTSALVFLATLAGEFTYDQILGATLVAGIVVAAIGIFGLSVRLAAIVPASIVFGILAGLVLPYIVSIFTELGNSPVLIGLPVLAYLLSSRLLRPSVPPVLPAVAAAVVSATVMGEISTPDVVWSAPEVQRTIPSISLPAILTISPVVVVLIAVQGNLAAMMYLKHQKYNPPQRLIDVLTGAGSALASFFGVGLVTMASMLTPLTAGPQAGDHHLRHWSVYAAGAGFVLVGLFAGVAAALGAVVPIALLLTLAGLALIGVLTQALREISRGPLVLGPLFAFAITLSDLSIGGLGSVFGGLVIGTGVSALLEGHRIFTPPRTPDATPE